MSAAFMAFVHHVAAFTVVAALGIIKEEISARKITSRPGKRKRAKA